MKRNNGSRVGTWMTFLIASIFTVTTMAHELGKEASPAERAFAYRDGLFHVIGWKMGVLGGMARGKTPEDPELFAKTAREIATLAQSIPEGFIPDSILDNSLAKPEIWDNMDDFKEKAANLEKAALDIANVAEQDFAKAKGMMKKFGGNCGACHRKYKVKTD